MEKLYMITLSQYPIRYTSTVLVFSLLLMLSASFSQSSVAQGIQIDRATVDASPQNNGVKPGEVFDITVDFQIWSQASCPGCVNQIVIGIEEDAQGCAYNNISGIFPGAAGSSTLSLTAPTDPGTYEIRYNGAQQFTCGDAEAAYESAPPTANSIATITVANSAVVTAMYSNVLIGGESGEFIATPGQSFDVSMDFEIWSQTSCPGCIDQIVVGIDEDAQGCAYNGIPGSFPGDAGSGVVTMTAPSDPGLYTIRQSIGQMFTCADAEAQYENAPPGEAAAIATLRVVNPDNAGLIFNNVMLAQTGENLLVIPGQTFELAADLQVWSQSSCPGCIDQVVIGIEADAQGCVYNGIPNVFPGESSAGTVMLMAPAEPGVYDIRRQFTQHFTCAEGQTAYESNPPGAGATIATIEVITRVSNEDTPEMVRDFSLKQNYPNPFKPVTTIDFELNQPGQVSLRVFDIQGKEISTLVEGSLATGSYSVDWNARGMPGGIYFYRLTLDGQAYTKSLTLIP